MGKKEREATKYEKVERDEGADNFWPEKCRVTREAIFERALMNEPWSHPPSYFYTLDFL